MSRAYCAEELVAEIASALLSAELGVAQWLELMKEDRAPYLRPSARVEAVVYLKSLPAK